MTSNLPGYRSKVVYTRNIYRRLLSKYLISYSWKCWETLDAVQEMSAEIQRKVRVCCKYSWWLRCGGLWWWGGEGDNEAFPSSTLSYHAESHVPLLITTTVKIMYAGRDPQHVTRSQPHLCTPHCILEPCNISF